MRTIVAVFTTLTLTLPAAYLAAAAQDPAKPGESKQPLSKTLAADPRLAALGPAVREKVLKEADIVKDLCASVDMPGSFYDCDCFAREAFDHRFKKGTELETAGSATRPASGEFTFNTAMLLADTEFQPSGCVAPAEKIEAWARKRLADPSMTDERKSCIGRQFASEFRKKPVASMTYTQELISRAMEACPRR